MIKLSNDQSGLTIVELLVALVITAFLTTLLIGFSVDKLEQGTLQNTKYQLLTNAETGLDTISNDIRVANSALDNNTYQDPYSPSAPTNQLSWASNSNTIVLATAAENSSGNIIFSDPTDYVSEKNNIIYYLSGTTLYRRVLAGPVANNAAITTCPPAHATASCPADSDILDNVSSFSVQYYNLQNQQVDPASARSIQLSVTLNVKKYSQNITTNYTTRMVFRND